MNLISIITICFNNPDELIATCVSVDSQTNKNFEHIIINGSTNGDIKNFLEHNPQPAYRSWINEKDDGIADAFNKGIKNAKGDILVMLNSGDMFYHGNSIGIVEKEFEQKPDIKWLHAKYELKRSNYWIIIGKPFARSKLYRGMRSICHQSMFVKKELHNKYGGYDTSLKIAMDYDFLVRIADEKFSFINTPIIKFSPAGISSLQYISSLKEIKKVYKKYFGNSLLLEIWQLRLRILYYVLRTRLGKILFDVKKGFGLENI